jgi:leucyl-tRNA synthetase
MKSFVYSKETDDKWQKKWRETALYKFDESRIRDKFYLLEMFSYPSGKNLHLGHWWNYGLSDSYGRFKRMQGYEVFHPPGFDAFGLPAENFAIKTGVHPKDSTVSNIAAMEAQMRAMGTTYDWDHEIVTCDESYYKWTQWLFLQLLKQGLAYRKEAPVNWCPSCLTVLANEQAAGGTCERCDSAVVRRSMTQWFFKITAYAEALLEGLDTLDWPEKTKAIQRNWIGRSTGAEIDFQAGNLLITVFTTRADTLMGVTYIVLAPEHPLVPQLTTPAQAAAVGAYIGQSAKQTDIERQMAEKEKAGVFTGSCCIHPVTGQAVPVWIADYVLPGYGTGAVMAVPAHDERDYAFAVQYGLPVVRVIGAAADCLPFCDDGILTGSGCYDGLVSEQARLRITADLERTGKGRHAVKYRLRDWLVSRQRYWGAPVPVIHCDRCGIVPVPEEDLPVRLPYDVEFQPNGQSPLALCDEFVTVPCPACGNPAKRDTDTLDTFVCSSWYFLRFYDSKNTREPFDRDRLAQIMPVDKYVGGIEHAAMHLLYARFITKALRDMGYLSFGEPFPSLTHQGIITGSDGRKMSKRNGAVSPDVLVNQYGADVLRLYLGFGFSYLDGGPWQGPCDDIPGAGSGIKAVARFVSKLCRLADDFISVKRENDAGTIADSTLGYIRHYTVKQVTAGLEAFSFNTVIARLMEFANAIGRYQKSVGRNAPFEEEMLKALLLLLAPLAPHLAEELWAHIGGPYSIHSQSFPKYDEARLVSDAVNIAVQVNGSLRDVVTVSPGADEEAVKRIALTSRKVQKGVGGREIGRIIYVKDKLINLVCG